MMEVELLPSPPPPGPAALPKEALLAPGEGEFWAMLPAGAPDGLAPDGATAELVLLPC